MSAVDDVVAWLTAQSLAGGSTGWDLVKRRKTDAPSHDQLVVVAEDGGPVPELKASTGLGEGAQADRGVLITVRAGAWDGDASAAKAEAIRVAAHGLRGTVGSGTYYRVRAMSPTAIFAGFDDTGRPHHTVALRMLGAA